MRRIALLATILAFWTACDLAVETADQVSTSQVADPAPGLPLLSTEALDRTGPSELLRLERLDPSTALALADAYLAQFGPYSAGALEREHGAAIDFLRLHPMGEGFLAHSPYEVNESLPIPVQNLLGGYYIFEFGQNDVPVIRIAIAASATHLRLEEGRIHSAKLKGNEFRTIGVPTDPAYGAVASPRYAQELVGRFIGGSVVGAGAPQFISYGIRHYPHFGVWRVPLPAPHDFVRSSTGGHIRSSVLFVTWNGLIGLPVVPTEQDEYVLRYRINAEDPGYPSLQLRPGFGSIVPVSIP